MKFLVRGVIVAANSRQEAEKDYHAVASGNAVCLVSKQDKFLVLSANSELKLHNPITGKDDLMQRDVPESFSFPAVASADAEIKTNYTVCVAGCGAHIIADDAEIMHHCVACGEKLQELDQKQIDDYVAKQQEGSASEGDVAPVTEPAAVAPEADATDIGSGSGEQPASGTEAAAGDEVSEGIVVVKSTITEAIAAFREVLQQKADIRLIKADNIAVAGDFKFDPRTGDALEEGAIVVATASAKRFTAIASSNSPQLGAHAFQCMAHDDHVVLSSDDAPVYCPACASGLIDPSEEEEDNFLDDEDDDLDYDEDEEDEEANAASVAIASDDEDDEEESDDDYEIDLDFDEEDEEEEDDSEANASSKPGATMNTGVKRRAEATARPGVDAPVPVTQKVTFDLLRQKFTGVDDLHLAHANVNGETSWIAFAGGMPVATASFKDSKHQDIFNSPSFHNIVLAAVQTSNSSDTLAEFGFKSVAASVDVDEYVAREVQTQVTAKVASETEAIQMEMKDYVARFATALATAAEGINTKFYKGVTNPVADRLSATLNSLGINNGEALVQQAFASGNTDYIDKLVGKTTQLMAMDVEVQNQMTEAIASVSNTVSTVSIGSPSTLVPQQQQLQQRTVAIAGGAVEDDVLARALNTLK